jgi:hypothetical protein
VGTVQRLLMVRSGIHSANCALFLLVITLSYLSSSPMLTPSPRSMTLAVSTRPCHTCASESMDLESNNPSSRPFSFMVTYSLDALLTKGAWEVVIKCRRGNGTRFVESFLMSELLFD